MFESPGRLVLALADGAGGTHSGATAAQAIIDAVRDAEPGTNWAALLEELDLDGARLGHGQSTAVIVEVTARGLTGASVGDSGAWLVRGDAVIDLTAGQARKPLVGDGAAACTFEHATLDAETVLVASDGLLRYAREQDIARIASGPDLAAAARALVELVRLPTGGLQDDVSVVLGRWRR